MDAQPLMIVKPEDLAEVFGLLLFACMLVGFVGAMAFRLLQEIGNAMGSMVRSTAWYNKRQAVELHKLATSERFLSLFPPHERESRALKLLGKAGQYQQKATAIEERKRWREQRRTQGAAS